MAGQNWIFPVIPENWDTIKSQRVFATGSESTIGKVSEGDKLLFFVSGTYSFRGIFQAASSWSKVTSPRYPNEVKERKIIYPFELKIDPIALGVADLRKIKQALSFIEVKQKWGIYVQSTPGNHRNPISDEDYNLILQEIQRNPDVESTVVVGLAGGPVIPVQTKVEFKAWVEIPEKSSHDQLIVRLMTIGEIFGFETVRTPPVNEIRPQDKPFFSKAKQLDVGWKMGFGAWVPIEVQVHGSIPDLIYRFQLVHQWSHRMIVVAESTFHEELKESTKTYPFHDKIVLLEPEEVLKGSDSLEGLRDLRRKIFQ
jgi:predicted RNA-binding protein